MNNVLLLHVKFKFPLPYDKVVWLKKPVSAILGDLRKIRDSSAVDYLNGIDTELFFNRDEETGYSENRYPLIHYKSTDGHAAITGINEGAVALQNLLSFLNENKLPGIGKRHLINKQNPVDLSEFYSPNVEKFNIQLLSRKKTYIIKNWLPLDNIRYKTWVTSPDLRTLADILSECLPRQISRMLSGLGVRENLPFIAEVCHILKGHPLQQVYKEKKLGFDCIFQTNLDLPADIGIGQVAGIGYGRIFPWNSKDYF